MLRRFETLSRGNKDTAEEESGSVQGDLPTGMVEVPKKILLIEPNCLPSFAQNVMSKNTGRTVHIFETVHKSARKVIRRSPLSISGSKLIKMSTGDRLNKRKKKQYQT